MRVVRKSTPGPSQGTLGSLAHAMDLFTQCPIVLKQKKKTIKFLTCF